MSKCLSVNPTHKFIFLNGPPRSGKDTLAKHLQEYRGERRVSIMKFASALKEATHAAYGFSGRHADHYERVKDEPQDDFFGLTPRAAYIAHSETYMKPLHGKDVYGRLFLRRKEHIDVFASEEPRLIIVTDSGFIDETLAVTTLIDPANMVMVRLHREGRTFSGDSRSYLYTDEYGIVSVDVLNNREIPTAAACIRMQAELLFACTL